MLDAIPTLDDDIKPTLHDYFFPETMDNTLGVVEGEMVPRLYETTENDDWRRHGASLSDELCSPWQSFRISEVEICPQWPGGALSTAPRKVRLPSGEIAFFKGIGPGGSSGTTRR